MKSTRGRYDNNKISKSHGKVSLMLWPWKVGLMRHIVLHCKITKKLFWFFCPLIRAAVFPLLLTFLRFLVADRHNEEYFFSFFFAWWPEWFLYFPFISHFYHSLGGWSARLVPTFYSSGLRKDHRDWPAVDRAHFLIFFFSFHFCLRFYFHLIKCFA